MTNLRCSALTKCALPAMLILFSSCSKTSEDLESRIANQWRGDDGERIEFAYWVNTAQPFNGLSKSDVRELLGPPTSKHDNREYPYNGPTEGFSPETFTAIGGTFEKPVQWIYQTLRAGSEESIEWSGEGSGYLLDLVVQFNVEGKVYGSGTNQFTTGGDYYELLDAQSN